MKVENIDTDLGNKILEDLKQQGWKLGAQYSPLAFDKGIDFDSYTLKKDQSKLYLEWTNWFEWEIHGSKQDLDQLAEKYELAKIVPSDLVKKWFGDQFTKLHPLLQKLHTDGGTLTGDVDIHYGKGLAGVIGRRLAKKMKLPEAGTHQLAVTISHDSAGLHWGRCFNQYSYIESLFEPVGVITHGYWIEATGPLTMKLTVDVKDGGWYWRCLSIRFMGLPVPRWLVPKTTAYKVIEDDQYRFHVEFSLPMLGSLVRYQGLLSAQSD
ncbi:DUF4166 domain-containing protein [Leucothrix pacifica]|uniref:DUF4166 domain-containing protein n=1 Tax=Leucothrix pacifica TaxID=1247513 RepID=UPI0015E82CF5|nr:DUF4166 domain-containing protein [Leucothrix pacifica]